MVSPDDGADYNRKIEVDLNKAESVIVGPDIHKAVHNLDSAQDLRFDRVIFNSCAGSNVLDLAILAEIVSDEETKIPVDVHLADPLTRVQAEKLGLLSRLLNAGVRMSDSHSCGPCMGQGATVKRGERVLSTNNRNYPGRLGDREAKVYLSSSVVAAITARLGRVASLAEVRASTGQILKAKHLVRELFG
jgi:methanogen homoaconitase large subunit